MSVRHSLWPHEIERRRTAWERYFVNSACLGRAPDMAMAGATSAPVAQQANLRCANSPARAAPLGGAAPADFLGQGAAPGVYCVVTYDHARDWAVREGLAMPRKAIDLRRINDVRKARGLVPFALRGEG